MRNITNRIEKIYQSILEWDMGETQDQRSLDKEERMKLDGEAERILAKEAPIMAIFIGQPGHLAEQNCT